MVAITQKVLFVAITHAARFGPSGQSPIVKMDSTIRPPNTNPTLQMMKTTIFNGFTEHSIPGYPARAPMRRSLRKVSRMLS